MLYSLSADVSFVYDHLAYYVSFHCVFNSYWGYPGGLPLVSFVAFSVLLELYCSLAVSYVVLQLVCWVCKRISM